MIYVLEPFFGGSHKQFLQGLEKHTNLPLKILPMSPYHWKWRMHGSSTYYANLFRENNFSPGTIFASDFVNLSALRGLIPHPQQWNWILYFHENQLTYPFREKRERDLTYAHFNILSALAADQVFFNSSFHRHDFLSAIPQFYFRFVDYKPRKVAVRIENKSQVLPIGLNLRKLDDIPDKSAKEGPGVILWSQRWEHDKNPDLFFNTLFQLKQKSVPFQLIVCGQQYKEVPKIFTVARERLAGHILHWGYVPSDEEYGRLLHRADIVVSTANHEFFGIAVLEAIYCGCFPLLPKRLVYPEYIPEERQANNLYTSDRDLYRKLKFALERIEMTREINFREIAARFDWSNVASLWENSLAV